MNALVTGGSRGIGKAISKELADIGYNLLIVSKSPENLLATTKELKADYSNRIEAYPTDLAKEDSFQKIKDFALQKDLIPSIIILDAGIFIEGNLSTAPFTDFYDTLNVNMLSIYKLVQIFIDDLKKQNMARIIIIGSTAAHEPYPIGALYGVVKWALRGYAINLRKELMNDGIGVTLISPGGTLTDLWAGEELPEDRLLDPSDIAKIVRLIVTTSKQAVIEDIIIRPMLGDIHE